MDTLDFILKIENTINDLGFVFDEEYGYKLGPYVVNIIEDDDNMNRVAVEILNLNNIETETMHDYNDVIRATTYFNTKTDSDKELNRRFDATIVNKIKNLPNYIIYLRKNKINNVRST